MGQINVVWDHTPTSATFDRRFIAIMPSTFPWELAVDAFLDFRDRLREGRIPRAITEPADLMDICVSAARRQR